MKTIEEYNEEAAKIEIPEWIPSGIMCPCGCKKELLEEKLPSVGRPLPGWPVKCQETDRQGRMVYSDTRRWIIKEIEWD